MNKKNLLMLAAGAFVALPACQNSSQKAQDQSEGDDSVKKQTRPNIIFIMSDDHAYQAMSCYGSKINETPNLDRIAQNGIRFDNSFVTNSISAPSRAVLLTGKYSHINGKIDNGNVFDGDQQTFPKLLQQAGYQTAMIGKWHLKSAPQGFDYWSILPGQGNYYNPEFIEMGDTIKPEGYVTDLITDISLKWLKEERDPNKPFCLLYHHKAPHREWRPNIKHLSMYANEDIPEPETLFDDYANRGSAAKEQEMTIIDHMSFSSDLKMDTTLVDKYNLTGESDWSRMAYKHQMNRMTEEQRQAWNAYYRERDKAFEAMNIVGDREALTKWKYQQYMKDYLRCVASVDENVGRVLDYLEESGLAENTIVIYTSDQGFYLGEHGWFDKRFMYKESFRMPLLISYPGVTPKGSVNKDLVMNLDFAPTFLDFAGVDIPEDIQGRSMRSIIEGKTPDNWRTSAYYHYYEYPSVHMVKRHYGIRTARYKLIHFYYDVDEWELYDLEKDPNEMNNVVDDPEYADVVVELKAELEALREKYGDSDELNEKFLY